MANFVENALVIKNTGQIGHLAMLFDVAEARVAEASYGGTADAGSYNLGVEAYYAIPHPDKQSEIALLVPPEIFHGFLEMRYMELRNTTVLVEAQGISFRDFLERCKVLTAGRLTADNEVIASWLVKKRGDLYKPVILGGGYRTNEKGGLEINWHIESPELQEEVNRGLGWHE